mmetsp:Transcript_2238/g.3191  ORF Transcript_2238/g.3191 Transcript_2238/m.3191 type:complete len:88 (+) Transcript_2238:48-311(+)
MKDYSTLQTAIIISLSITMGLGMLYSMVKVFGWKSVLLSSSPLIITLVLAFKFASWMDDRNEKEKRASKTQSEAEIKPTKVRKIRVD